MPLPYSLILHLEILILVERWLQLVLDLVSASSWLSFLSSSSMSFQCTSAMAVNTSIAFHLEVLNFAKIWKLQFDENPNMTISDNHLLQYFYCCYQTSLYYYFLVSYVLSFGLLMNRLWQYVLFLFIFSQTKCTFCYMILKMKVFNKHCSLGLFLLI